MAEAEGSKGGIPTGDALEHALVWLPGGVAVGITEGVAAFVQRAWSGEHGGLMMAMVTLGWAPAAALADAFPALEASTDTAQKALVKSLRTCIGDTMVARRQADGKSATTNDNVGYKEKTSTYLARMVDTARLPTLAFVVGGLPLAPAGAGGCSTGNRMVVAGRTEWAIPGERVVPAALEASRPVPQEAGPGGPSALRDQANPLTRDAPAASAAPASPGIAAPVDAAAVATGLAHRGSAPATRDEDAPVPHQRPGAPGAAQAPTGGGNPRQAGAGRR